MALLKFGVKINFLTTKIIGSRIGKLGNYGFFSEIYKMEWVSGAWIDLRIFHEDVWLD